MDYTRLFAFVNYLVVVNILRLGRSAVTPPHKWRCLKTKVVRDSNRSDCAFDLIIQTAPTPTNECQVSPMLNILAQ